MLQALLFSTTHRFDPVNQFLTSSSFFYTIAIGLVSIYTYISPNYDLNFGFNKGTLKGQHFSVTLHPEDISICELIQSQGVQKPLANIIGLTTLIKQADSDPDRDVLTDMLSHSAADLIRSFLISQIRVVDLN